MEKKGDQLMALPLPSSLLAGLLVSNCYGDKGRERGRQGDEKPLMSHSGTTSGRENVYLFCEMRLTPSVL
jgi:hypothetical protein